MVESGKDFGSLYSILDFASTNCTFGVENIGRSKLFGTTTRGYSHFRTIILMNLGNRTSTGTSLSFNGSIGVSSGKKRHIVMIVDLERECMMNWGKNNGQVVVYIYLI
jgi:hypothetical protein